MMGEEDNAFIRMVTSVTNLAQMNANFTMINKLNEIFIRKQNKFPFLINLNNLTE